MHGYRMPIACLVLAPAMAAPAISHAQTGERASSLLDEIVVTARKREESIQEIPLTVQVFSSEQLEQRGITNLPELSKFTPGLTYNQGNARFSSDFSIRGMTQSSAPGDNRRDLVTVFIDGVPYIGNPAGVGTEDLARVEVIKGPQSALFGRATFGGAISMITTTPGDEFLGRVSATGGSYGDRRISGSVEGPLLEGLLAGRLVADYSDFDGFYANEFGGRLGQSRQRFYAGSLSFTPADQFSARVRYSVRRDKDGPAASVLIARSDEHNCGPFPGFQPRPLFGLPEGFTLEQARRAFCGALRTPDGPFAINNELPEQSLGILPFDEHKLLLDHDLLSGSADWEIQPGYTLTAIASTQKQRIRQLQDGGLEMTMLEMVLLFDLDTGEPLESWRNPYTGEEIPVRFRPAGPFKVRYRPDNSRVLPTDIGGTPLEASAKSHPPLIVNDDVFVQDESVARVFTPGRERPFQVNDIAVYHGSLRNLADPAVTMGEATVFFGEITDWQRWMNMDERPGTLTSRSVGRKCSRWEDLPEGWRRRLAEVAPDIADDPIGALDEPAPQFER
ncbi:MAG: DUF1838 domain-containing protein [Gammaproteobacteria bacterium]|nr:MAG: DUF1838 domain-containing protein [Gammaproteobacteria bacterium]